MDTHGTKALEVLRHQQGPNQQADVSLDVPSETDWNNTSPPEMRKNEPRIRATAVREPRIGRISLLDPKSMYLQIWALLHGPFREDIDGMEVASTIRTDEDPSPPCGRTNMASSP
ncbi:hypothetical protein ABZX51_000607 [Aspergillus tubingensis]